jgi:ADP-heptose:LPS heptosyltransferase
MLPRRNVLIFHNAALGDFVLTWPLAIALGRLHPQSRIMYVTAGSKGKLAERVLGVDSLDVEAGWSTLFSDGADVPATVSASLARAHAIYDLAAGAGTAWAANVARLAPEAEVTHLAPRPPDDYPRHATAYLTDQLASRPAVASAVEQILRWVADRGVANRRTNGDAVVIHPGSGSPAKNWPLERFVELAARLTAGGRAVRIILGEVERERWPRADVARLEGAGEVVAPGNYLGLLDAVNGAQAFVGNDSGPTHLAGIVGVPTVGVYLAHKVATWRPLGPRVTVVDGKTLDAVSVDAVAKAVGLT